MQPGCLSYIKTGKIDVQGDFRAGMPGPEWEVVIPFRDYYPHNWKRPFAAYLIPPDLQIGEEGQCQSKSA